MNHIANQLIFKIVISVQKLSILVLNFKNFLKNIFKQGFPHFFKSSGHTKTVMENSSAVAKGSQGGRAPQMTACALTISVYFACFRSHSRFFSSLTVAQPEEKELSAPFSQVIWKI